MPPPQEESRNKLQNLMRHANQANTIRNPYPTNTSYLQDDMLKAASSGNFDLLANTKINTGPSEAAAAKCRTYQGVPGLRQLIADQGNRTFYEGGCGWRYKPSAGVNPQSNIGALGTGAGPSFGQALSPDEVTGGTQWLWDLNEAEKKISTDICSKAPTCNHLGLLPDQSVYCGWCTTTARAIPIITNAQGNTVARYRKDPQLGCESANITTLGNCATATQSGFKNFEGFVTASSLDDCDMSPLTRDCVLQAARFAGCTDEGTLIKALQQNTGSNYDTVLKGLPVYKAYNSVALPSMTKATLRDGSVTLNTALNDFHGLMKNTSSPSNKKLMISAQDLCLNAGQYDKYDFCSEMTDQTIIDSTNVKCVQNDWLKQGGTKRGAGYSNLSFRFMGKSWSQYANYMSNLQNKISGEGFVDKATNANALMELFGTNSISPDVGLPMVDVTRGAEVVWFDFNNPNREVVILRSYIGPIPYFTDSGKHEFLTAYNLNNGVNKAYTTAFEIRKLTDDTVSFDKLTSDGFILSKNQNPFEGTSYSRNDWGGWLRQTSTKYSSAPYTIDNDNKGIKNIFVEKWFTLGGISVSKLDINYSNGDPIRADHCNDIYLTQEPYAPWLQYEICSRPNFQTNETGFFEKRWNGPCAYSVENGVPYPSFDVNAKSVVVQTKSANQGVPANRGYLTFNAGSQWSTESYFHFTVFKTITLLIRPIANLSANNTAPIFTHKSPDGKQGYTLFLRNTGGNYSIGLNNSLNDVKMNVWNLVVVQYIGDQRGVSAFKLSVSSLESLSTATSQQAFVQTLTTHQNSFNAVIAGGNGNYLMNSGRLALGIPDASTTQSFTGDVAWIHGFRDYITTADILAKEVAQSWISRWPRPNL